MRKAISPIIATILLIMITVVASGAAYFWITAVSSGVQETAGGAITVSGCSRINLIAMRGDGVTVQNTGCDTIENITVLIDGVLTNYNLDEPLDPGQSAIVLFSEPLEGGEDHSVDVLLGNGFSGSISSPGPNNIGPAGYVGYCSSNTQCDDENVCTDNICAYNRCIYPAYNGQYPGCTGSTGCSGSICGCVSGRCVNSCGDGVCQSWETSLTCPSDNCAITCSETTCSSPNVMFTGAVFGSNIGDICPCCGDDGTSDTFYNNELGRADKFCYKGVYAKSTLDNNKSLCEGFGNTWFRSSSVSFTNYLNYDISPSSTGLALADLDLDGDLDIVTSSAVSKTIDVRFNNGGGYFTKHYTKELGSASDIAIADMNNDSSPDIVMANVDSTVYVALNNGSGYFFTATAIPAPTNLISVAIGDLDGDSDLDVVTTSTNNILSVYFNNGSGYLHNRIDYTNSGSNDVALGDMNNDGKLDIASINGSHLIIRLNNGAGAFTSSLSYSISSGSCLSLGDFNSDSKLDVAIETNSKANTYYNSGSSFSLTGEYTSGGNCLTLGDINGDTRLDIVTSTLYTLLWNSFYERFDSPYTGTNPTNNVKIVLGDLDGDGDLDAARNLYTENLLQLGFNNMVEGSNGLCCGDDGASDVFYNKTLFCNNGVVTSDADLNSGFCNFKGNNWFTGIINGSNGPCCGDDGASDNFDNGINSCCSGVLKGLNCTAIARINSASVVQLGSGLRGYCNASVSENSGILSYYYNWTKNGVMNLSGVLFKEGSLSMFGGGGSFYCGINTSNSRVLCSGYNTYGQLGDGTTVNYRLNFVPTIDPNAYLSVSAGGSHTCGIRANDSRVLCWGSNINGQLGDNTTTQRNIPTLTVDPNAYLSVSAGGSHTCGIRANDSRVLCWGNNGYGQLGDGSIIQKSSPVLTTDPSAYSSISVGLDYACGIIASDGRVKCWGWNSDGRLGDGTLVTQRSAPTLIVDSSAYLSVSAGGDHTCGIIASDGRVKCWGADGYGQLGDNNLVGKPTPTLTVDPSAYLSVSAGSQYTCGIRANDSRVLCWGRNIYGVLGDGTTNDHYIPKLIYNSSVYTGISAGSLYTCGIRANDSKVLCWGQTKGNLYPTLAEDTAILNVKSYENKDLLVNTVSSSYYSSGETWIFSCKVNDTINNVRSDWMSARFITIDADYNSSFCKLAGYTWFTGAINGSNGPCCGDDLTMDNFNNDTTYCFSGITDYNYLKSNCTSHGYTWFTGSITGNKGPCCGDNGLADNFYNGSIGNTTYFCNNGIFINQPVDFNQSLCEYYAYNWINNSYNTNFSSYSFENDIIGGRPSGWTVVDSFYNNFYIINDTSDLLRAKILRMYIGSSDVCTASKTFISNATSGSVEAYFKFQTPYDGVPYARVGQINLLGNGGYIRISLAAYKAYDGQYCKVYKGDPAGPGIANCVFEAWQRVKIDFDVNLGWNVWYNGVRLGSFNYAFSGTPTNIYGVQLAFDNRYPMVTTGNIYFDDIDYSWDPNRLYSCCGDDTVNDTFSNGTYSCCAGVFNSGSC